MNYDFPQAHILGCKLHLAGMEQCLNQISSHIESDNPMHVITLNAEMLYLARDDLPLQTAINRAELVTADGIGVVWGARYLGYEVPERVSGIDLMLALAAKAAEKGWPLYLLGAEPGVAQQAAQRMRQDFPGLSICGLKDGYFTPEQLPGIIADIKDAKPKILFVFMSNSG